MTYRFFVDGVIKRRIDLLFFKMTAVYLHILESEFPLKGKSLTPTIADDARNPTNGEFTFAVSIYSSACTVILHKYSQSRQNGRPFKVAERKNGRFFKSPNLFIIIYIKLSR